MQPTPDFNPAVAAKKLLREGRSGALATLMPGSGDPYCSLVNVATAADGAPRPCGRLRGPNPRADEVIESR
jgi:heme iron utilization protein